MKPPFTFDDGECVITAFGTHVSGPGWSNTPIWVIVRARDGRMREECIQPTAQTNEMREHFSYSALAHRNMTAAVVAAVKKEALQ